MGRQIKYQISEREKKRHKEEPYAVENQDSHAGDLSCGHRRRKKFEYFATDGWVHSGYLFGFN